MQVPTVLKPVTWTNRRQIILYRYMLQIGANGMARFGLFCSRFLISSPRPPRPPPPPPPPPLKMYTLRY